MDNNLIIDDIESEENLVQCAVNYAEACRILETPDRYIKNAENFLKEFVFEKYLPGRYKKPAGRKDAKKVSNNNFERRDYDFEDLESQLLNANQGGGS